MRIRTHGLIILVDHTLEIVTDAHTICEVYLFDRTYLVENDSLY